MNESCRCLMLAAVSLAAACASGPQTDVAPGGVATLDALAVVDSAAAARAAWTDAVRASRANDPVAALRALDRATAAWPTQPAYHWSRAVVAARLQDTATTIAALAQYASFGLGRDLSDSSFAFLKTHSAFAAIERRHEANRAPMPRSRVVARLADSTLWPEGMDVNPRTGVVYVTSIRHRTIVAVTHDGRERDLIPRHTAGFGAFMGVRVDARRGILWATHAGLRQMQGWTPVDSGAELVALRLRDGTMLRRIPLNPAERHIPGDLAIAPNGDVLVTDSEQPAIHLLRAGQDTFERIRHPLFRSLQGIAVTATGDVAYVADYSHGLLRLDLATLTVARVEAPSNVTTLGIDGIALLGNSIIGIQNGVTPPRVVRFRLDASGTQILSADVIDRNTALADEPTIGAIAGNDFLYIGNSQWEKYDAEGTRRPSAALTRPAILGVPLR